MSAKNMHDYVKLRGVIIDLIRAGNVKPSWINIAKHLDMSPNTLIAAANREWKVRKPMDLLGIPDEDMTLGKQDKVDGNVREVSFTDKRITTLDELLKFCKVDLRVWDVKDYLVNKWEYGVADGTAYPLYQVKAWLVRKVLKPFMPVIQPVTVSVPKPVRKVKQAKGQKLKRALIIPDVHAGFKRRLNTQELIPFHDRRVLDIGLQILESQKFDKVIFIGDVLDLAEWSSKFTPEPEFYFTTQPALIELSWWLAQYSANCADMDIYEGNHDKRLEDLTANYLKAAYGLRPVDELDLPPTMSVERLLALHTLGINYLKGYPDNGTWLNENVMVRHGDVVRAGAGDTAKAVVNKTTYTTIFGHIHRRELVARRIQTRNGDVIQHAFSPGCACHTDGRVPGSTNEQQWQQGIAEVVYSDTFETIVPIPIFEGRAIYEGQVYRARERDAEVEMMLNEKLVGIGN